MRKGYNSLKGFNRGLAFSLFFFSLLFCFLEVTRSETLCPLQENSGLSAKVAAICKTPGSTCGPYQCLESCTKISSGLDALYTESLKNNGEHFILQLCDSEYGVGAPGDFTDPTKVGSTKGKGVFTILQSDLIVAGKGYMNGETDFNLEKTTIVDTDPKTKAIFVVAGGTKNVVFLGLKFRKAKYPDLTNLNANETRRSSHILISPVESTSSSGSYLGYNGGTLVVPGTNGGIGSGYGGGNVTKPKNCDYFQGQEISTTSRVECSVKNLRVENCDFTTDSQDALPRDAVDSDVEFEAGTYENTYILQNKHGYNLTDLQGRNGNLPRRKTAVSFRGRIGRINGFYANRNDHFGAYFDTEYENKSAALDVRSLSLKRNSVAYMRPLNNPGEVDASEVYRLSDTSNHNSLPYFHRSFSSSESDNIPAPIMVIEDGGVRNGFADIQSALSHYPDTGLLRLYVTSPAITINETIVVDRPVEICGYHDPDVHGVMNPILFVKLSDHTMPAFVSVVDDSRDTNKHGLTFRGLDIHINESDALVMYVPRVFNLTRIQDLNAGGLLRSELRDTEEVVKDSDETIIANSNVQGGRYACIMVYGGILSARGIVLDSTFLGQKEFSLWISASEAIVQGNFFGLRGRLNALNKLVTSGNEENGNDMSAVLGDDAARASIVIDHAGSDAQILENQFYGNANGSITLSRVDGVEIRCNSFFVRVQGEAILVARDLYDKVYTQFDIDNNCNGYAAISGGECSPATCEGHGGCPPNVTELTVVSNKVVSFPNETFTASLIRIESGAASFFIASRNWMFANRLYRADGDNSTHLLSYFPVDLAHLNGVTLGGADDLVLLDYVSQACGDSLSFYNRVRNPAWVPFVWNSKLPVAFPSCHNFEGGNVEADIVSGVLRVHSDVVRCQQTESQRWSISFAALAQSEADPTAPAFFLQERTTVSSTGSNQTLCDTAFCMLGDECDSWKETKLGTVVSQETGFDTVANLGHFRGEFVLTAKTANSFVVGVDCQRSGMFDSTLLDGKSLQVFHNISSALAFFKTLQESGKLSQSDTLVAMVAGICNECVDILEFGARVVIRSACEKRFADVVLNPAPGVPVITYPQISPTANSSRGGCEIPAFIMHSPFCANNLWVHASSNITLFGLNFVYNETLDMKKLLDQDPDATFHSFNQVGMQDLAPIRRPADLLARSIMIQDSNVTIVGCVFTSQVSVASIGGNGIGYLVLLDNFFIRIPGRGVMLRVNRIVVLPPHLFSDFSQGNNLITRDAPEPNYDTPIARTILIKNNAFLGTEDGVVVLPDREQESSPNTFASFNAIFIIENFFIGVKLHDVSIEDLEFLPKLPAVIQDNVYLGTGDTGACEPILPKPSLMPRPSDAEAGAQAPYAGMGGLDTRDLPHMEDEDDEEKNLQETRDHKEEDDDNDNDDDDNKKKKRTKKPSKTPSISNSRSSSISLSKTPASSVSRTPIPSKSPFVSSTPLPKPVEDLAGCDLDTIKEGLVERNEKLEIVLNATFPYPSQEGESNNNNGLVTRSIGAKGKRDVPTDWFVVLGVVDEMEEILEPDTESPRANVTIFVRATGVFVINEVVVPFGLHDRMWLVGYNNYIKNISFHRGDFYVSTYSSTFFSAAEIGTHSEIDDSYLGGLVTVTALTPELLRTEQYLVFRRTTLNGRRLRANTRGACDRVLSNILFYDVRDSATGNLLHHGVPALCDVSCYRDANSSTIQHCAPTEDGTPTVFTLGLDTDNECRCMAIGRDQVIEDYTRPDGSMGQRVRRCPLGKEREGNSMDKRKNCVDFVPGPGNSTTTVTVSPSPTLTHKPTKHHLSDPDWWFWVIVGIAIVFLGLVVFVAFIYTYPKAQDGFKASSNNTRPSSTTLKTTGAHKTSKGRI